MNTSGIQPVEYKVLIKPKQIEEKTAGGIILPGAVRDKEKYSQVEGTLVAVGSIAFTSPDWLECPKAGDTVLYDKFAGCTVTGRDGIDYRIISDKEIGAIFSCG